MKNISPKNYINTDVIENFSDENIEDNIPSISDEEKSSIKEISNGVKINEFIKNYIMGSKYINKRKKSKYTKVVCKKKFPLFSDFQLNFDNMKNFKFYFPSNNAEILFPKRNLRLGTFINEKNCINFYIISVVLFINS